MFVRTEQKEFWGELIEVRDDGIVLLATNSQDMAHPKSELRFVRYQGIVSSSIDDSHYSFPNRRAPKPSAREQLRLLSRFPQGLTPELARQLLQAYGQTELVGDKP